MMNLQKTHAPHIRTTEDSTVMMRDVAFALFPLVLIAFYYYGVRAIAIVFVSVLTCFLADTFCLMIQKKKRSGNISPLVTGMIIALMMPASIPYAIVVAAGLFAILVVKHPFGGLGNNIFNPACAGVAFAMISWNTEVMSYPEPFPLGGLPLFGEITTKLAPGPASLIQDLAVPVSNNFDLLSGNFSGPMGTTNVLVIGCCALYLLYRHVISWQIPVSFVGAAALSYLLYPRLSPIGITWYRGIVLELCVGALFFCAIFVATDPVTSPTFRLSKGIYGAACGFLTMIFRFFGNFPEGVMFSILIMNALSGFIDKFVLDWKAGNNWVRQLKDVRERYKNQDEYQALKQKAKEDKERRQKEAAERRAKRQEERKQKAEERAALLAKKAEEKAEEEKKLKEIEKQKVEEKDTSFEKDLTEVVNTVPEEEVISDSEDAFVELAKETIEEDQIESDSKETKEDSLENDMIQTSEEVQTDEILADNIQIDLNESIENVKEEETSSKMDDAWVLIEESQSSTETEEENSEELPEDSHPQGFSFKAEEIEILKEEETDE